MSDSVKDSIEDRVVAILAEQALLDPSEIRRDASPADLGVDSLGLVEVVFALEEAFDIQIPFNANDPAQKDAARPDFDISTVDSLVQAVKALVAAREQL
ncbi:phosphopantetheine-binding protein [Amaricoccus sp. HAR-UPW-R2A-40]|nr:phosphopantetheine-binding protein [Amaricoccus sp. HAR-UPW-R2A-40]